MSSGWIRSRLTLCLRTVLVRKLWWWDWSSFKKHKSRSNGKLKFRSRAQGQFRSPVEVWCGAGWQVVAGLGDHGFGGRHGHSRWGDTPSPSVLPLQWGRKHSNCSFFYFLRPHSSVPFSLARASSVHLLHQPQTCFVTLSVLFSRSFNAKTYSDSVWKCVFLVLDRIFSTHQFC